MLNSAREIQLVVEAHPLFCLFVCFVCSLEFLNDIVVRDHSIENYWAGLSCCTVYYAVQGMSNFWVCLNYWEILSWGTVHYGVQGGSNFGFFAWNPGLYNIQVKAAEHHFPMVLFIMIYHTALNLLLFCRQTSRTERREFFKNVTAETGRPATAGCCGVCGRKRTIGTLRSDDGDGNENGKKAIGLISKTTTLHVHHAFFVHFLAVVARLQRENA